MTTPNITLIVTAAGTMRGLYDESIDFTLLGDVAVRRASHVEPDEDGQWHADLSPVGGPVLGPFAKRSGALAAERVWLEARLHTLREATHIHP